MAAKSTKTSNDNHPVSENAKPGTERARDEQREGGGPRYAGGSWGLADERAPDQRFGHARIDNADLAEVGHDSAIDPEAEGKRADNEVTASGDMIDSEDDGKDYQYDDAEDLVVDEGPIETGSQHQGMGRGAAKRS